ncbi:MAG: bifunctional aspartate kinase/homoserine dehydrogenase I [Bdellovibrionota bacterium]|jgi:aspartokinase/homoserine dehydrogenase 1
MRILKFGGSSLATPEKIKNVISIIQEARREREALGVVFSAFSGVTDALIAIGAQAITPSEDYKTSLQALEDRHTTILKQLIPTPDQSPALLTLKMWFNDLEDILQGIHLIGELSPRCLDRIMSFGERLSAYIISQAIAGAEFLDSREIIRSDDSYGCGRVLPISNDLIREYFSTHKALQIITGFIASTVDNNTTTLGRGGSDYTAAIIAAALNCKEIEIWTDVDGLMTADPNKVPKAFSITDLSYEEAMELSHFGAKVIYPPTMQPALDNGLSIRILNSFNPSYQGTVISKEPSKDRPVVTGISSISHIALIRVEGSGMVGVTGISKRLFGALAENNISVILITQASSEHTICFAVQPEHAEEACSAITKEFKLEIDAKILANVIIEKDLSIVSVVGEHMRNSPGLAGRTFYALGKNGINISAIAQGSSELNISAVIPYCDETKALNALHDEFFFPDKKSINVFLIGTGLIGGELLRQIAAQQQFLDTELAHEIKVIAIANSRKMFFAPHGVDLKKYTELLETTSTASDLSQFIKQMQELNLPNSVLVDCTASSEVPAIYEAVLKSSISIVTPNKRSQTADLDLYLSLKKAARRRGVSFLYETSVGAGLPILSTLNDLLKSGDEIIKIEAVLSGTLSYIFNSFTAGSKFSDIVLQAKEAGYTEPDPRDDLNGLDVARKILILARESGLELELQDVDIQNLVPEECRNSSSVHDFFECLKRYDPYFEDLRAKAEACGKKMAYIASLSEGRAVVSLQSIDETHPFYNLSGSDNIISFTTSRYKERPLVVKGPGAGSAVTAAGVFADIIRIAN